MARRGFGACFYPEFSSAFRSLTALSSSQPAGFYAASKAAVHGERSASCSGTSASETDYSFCPAAIGETYASELRPFGVRVLIVAPGAFRTEGVHAYPATIHNHVPVYDEMRNAGMARFAQIAGHEKGDPAKAMELLVDVVRGEGKARGKAWSLYLPLGSTAEEAVRGKAETMLGVLEEWGEIIRDLDLDE